MSLRFDSRHLPLLEAMGIVPWVLEGDAVAVVEAPAVVDVSGHTLLRPEAVASEALVEARQPQEGHVNDPHAVLDAGDSVTAAAPITAPQATDLETFALPLELNALANWLPSQRLAAFKERGVIQHMTGSKTARLVVVVEPMAGVANQVPLSGDALRLFELMMRAISLSRRDVAITGLAGGNTSVDPALNTEASEETLAIICTDHTRAVVLLQQQWAYQSTNAAEHHTRLALHQLPVWRLPHPDLLLQQSALKRPAWQMLKAVQSVLSGV